MTFKARFLDWLTDKFELQRGGFDKNNSTMEGLRGLAVFLVFLVHYGACATLFHAVSDSTTSVVVAFRKVGEIGVDLFFVLSGYLIYGALIAKPFTYFRFMKRRIIRIYPAFLAVFVVYLGLSAIFPDKSKIPADLPDAALYVVQNVLLLPGIFNIEPIITVAWSLSYEMFFYIIMPIVIRVLGMQRWSSSFRIALLGALTLAALPALAAAGGPVRLVMFLSGAILFETLRRPEHLKLPPFVGFAALGAALVAPLVPLGGLPGTVFRMGTMYAAFFLLCFACFTASDNRVIVRLFSFTPLRWLGNMSYSYYLVHGLALNGAFMITGKLTNAVELSLPVFLIILPLYLAVTLIASAVPFLLVELRYSLKKQG
jgi:exopolysaccharide production protein ExoZ